MTALEIASLVQGEVVGDSSVRIHRVAKIEDAVAGDLTFLANPKYDKFVSSTHASAILVSTAFDTARSPERSAFAFIRVRDPYIAFLQVMKRIMPLPDPFPKGVHPTAVVSDSARVESDVSLGAHVVIGPNAAIGSGTKIAPNCVIGNDVIIGKRCVIYPNVSIYHGCQVGDDVVIHSGAVIGSDGFGFAPKSDGSYEKIPQLGIVVIEDDVEIGANCTIDRATMGQSTVGRGVKLDNLVHLAHNVSVGENTVIAAQTGVSGSTKIGKNVMIAGQVGIVGHVEIGDKTIIMAKSGIAKTIEGGKTYWGVPAKEHMRALKIEAVVRSLPELAKDVEQLKHLLEELRDHYTETKT